MAAPKMPPTGGLPSKIYKAARGAHLSDADAAKIGPALEALAREHGTDIKHVRPDIIVEAAREAASPLHNYFEWNQEGAAFQYHLMQARYLARSIRIQIVVYDRPESPILLPGMVSLKVRDAASDRVYVPMAEALDRPEYIEQLAGDALQRITYWRNRFQQWRHLAPFARLEPIFAAIESVEASED